MFLNVCYLIIIVIQLDIIFFSKNKQTKILVDLLNAYMDVEALNNENDNEDLFDRIIELNNMKIEEKQYILIY